MLLCLTIFYDLFRVQRAVTGMVFVFISVLVEMACCPCSCFYSPLFHDEILQSWTKVLWHNFICGAFFNSHMPSPCPTPQTTLDACIQNFFRVYYSTVPRTFVQDCRFHFGLRKKARWRAMSGDTGNPNAVLANKINSNYSPQWIPLATDTEVNNCFSIY